MRDVFLFLNLHPDSVLSVSEFAYLSNYVFTQKEKGKNLIDLIQKLEQNPNNEQFINELQYARASQNYFLDDKLKALEIAQNRMNADSTAKDNPFTLAYLAWLAKEQNSSEAMVKRSPFTTMTEYENALKHSPLNLQLISQFTAFCNQQKQSRKGYDYVLRVKEYLPQSAKLQALYVQQCLAINMYDYAQTGMTQLQIMDEKAYFELLPAFEEKIKGSVESGKLADLVVLGRDPMKENPSTLITIPVERTMAGGKWVYES